MYWNPRVAAMFEQAKSENKNMAELTNEEFRKSLFKTFRSRGVLEALKVSSSVLQWFILGDYHLINLK